MNNLIFYISLSISVIYAALIFRYFLYLKINPSHEELINLPEFSIVIPFRNEEKNLPDLFRSLENLQYPKSFTEVIFVNDQSEDNSEGLIKNFLEKYKNGKLVQSKNGKKQAIFQGVSNSSFSLIACTDADCKPNPDWLQKAAIIFQNQNIQLILGSVLFDNERRLFTKICDLEFSGLIASTAGSVFVKNAIMANGASLYFRKTLYLKLYPKLLNSSFQSGDDAFLLAETKNNYGKHSIDFCLHPNAAVYTRAPKNLMDFFNQRLRWASKSHAYGGNTVFFIAMLVVLANINVLILLASPFFSILNSSIPLILTAIGIKILMDFLLVKRFRDFFGKSTNPLIFLLSWIFIPLYYAMIILVLPFYKGRWKGRKL